MNEDSVKFDLCIGPSPDGIFLEFRDVEVRDAVYSNMVKSPLAKAEWFEKRGDGGPQGYSPSHIIIHADKMPYAFRWACAFSEK